MSVLNTAHAMGVVHRDLKPENIMIGKSSGGSESTVKLLDLGIAKMREIAGVESSGTTELTMAGQVLGTPYYMSPEQWGELSRDGNFEIDGRADIYSLGLVAYQMISGKRAYSGTTLHELRREHLAVIPPPLGEVSPDVSGAFSEAINRAISKDRDDRQATAGELADELRAALASSQPSLAETRTLPDMPHPDSASSPTGQFSQASDTNSDVNAPTIITLDAVPTSSPNAGGAQARGGQAAAASAQAQPAMRPFASAGDMASIVTVQQPPRAQAVEKKSRGKSLALVGGAALLLILLVVGAAGFFAFNWWSGKPSEKSSATGTDGTSGTSSAATTEFGRYWLEVLPSGLVAEPQRVAGAVPLKSGQAFKFHFELDEDGYLYIVGPGEGNQPTAFLTEKPASISGLDSNRVTKGSDFSFPSGLEHWLELDKKPGTENYTIVFTSEPLSAPAFFSQEATGKPLGDSEQAEFNTFLSQNKTSEPVTELNDKGTEPFVTVKVPRSRGTGSPVIFGVRIQHK